MVVPLHQGPRTVSWVLVWFPEPSGIRGTKGPDKTDLRAEERRSEAVLEQSVGGGSPPGRGHRTARGCLRAEGIAQPGRVSRWALGTPPLALVRGVKGTVAATYPVPHDFTHATICLEVTLQGHGITSHHGWERLNVDSQVAYGGEKRRIRS